MLPWLKTDNEEEALDFQITQKAFEGGVDENKADEQNAILKE